MYKMNLVELRSISPNIRLDVRYATPFNFTGKVVYPSARVYLIDITAKRLHRVQTALEKKGLGIKVYDGYRPLSVQKIFWNLLPNTRFVADPAIGSKHNRGTAVDVTLVDPYGRDLPMPTSYDEFTEKAHRCYRGCSPEAGFNRDLLESAMCGEGFIPYPEEWWHFDDPDWENYPILDISFEEL